MWGEMRGQESSLFWLQEQFWNEGQEPQILILLRMGAGIWAEIPEPLISL